MVLVQLIEFFCIHHPSVFPRFLLGFVIDCRPLMASLPLRLPFCHEHLYTWTICWLLVMVNWLSWVAKSDSCSVSMTCFSDFSKQSSTHAVLDITSDGGSFALDRRYSLTSLLHSSTAILTSAIQSSLNKGSSGANSYISTAHANLSLHFELLSNNFPCKNFNFVPLPCSSMSLFIWLIFMVMIDFLPDLFHVFSF